MPKTKLELQTEINNQLNELSIKKFSAIHKSHYTDLELLTDIINEFTLYKQGIVSADDTGDNMLKDIIKVTKWAFINSQPGLNEDIKKRCQRIINVTGTDS